ncbi:2OG-Fe dioxygenase family protein, partial [Streptomyces caeruleatus]
PLDKYLKEGATFRYRRFGRFKLDSNNPQGTPELLSQKAFFQSSDLNEYAGGVQRVFEPLEQEMTENLFLHNLLINLFSIIPDEERTKFRYWEAGLHPTRVVG